MILRGDNAGGRGSRPPSDGVTAAMPTGDCDYDGDWDATDAADIGSNYTPGSAYAVRRDADLDGDVDAADVTHANSITGGYQTLGRDKLSSTAIANRKSYAGYEYDPTFNGLDRHLFHVRHRVYDAELGRWTRRDPLGYVDGMSVYEYAHNQQMLYQDPLGLFCETCAWSIPPTLPTLPIAPSPVSPGPLWVPSSPTPICVPGPRIQSPVLQCFLVGTIFYCIGEWLSPELIPDTPPHSDPPKPIGWSPQPKTRSEACLEAIRHRDTACGRPGIPSPPTSFPKGLNKGRPNSDERRRWCDVLRRNIHNLNECLKARSKVTNACYGGQLDFPHELHESEDRARLERMNKIYKLYCKK